MYERNLDYEYCANNHPGRYLAYCADRACRLPSDRESGHVVSAARLHAGRCRRLPAVRAYRQSGDGMRLRVPPDANGGAAAQAPHSTRLPAGIASVLSVLSSSSVVLDSDDRVLRSSTAARDFGLVEGDQMVVGELLALVRQVRRDGEIREGEIEISTTSFNGRITTFAVRVAPLGPRVGDGGLVLLLAEDRTESRRVEEVRRDFVANTSHELKTPVGALALLAETVEDAADDPEAVRRFAGRMRQEASRLTNLVQDMITLSRIQAAEPVPDPVPVALDAVVSEAIDRCRMKAAAGGIELAASGAHAISVLGEEDLLVTALRNLLENAVAYSPERTRVVVSTRRADSGHAEISVTDQGIGIPERDLERIFERFYRVDPARSRATGGTGLGLAIVKHVMAAHGGIVRVWSKEGAGSTFTLRLPSLPLGPGTSGNGAAHGHSAREAAK
jgi:two-component system, OmpR family, sensor histidine kinase SenX3